MLARGALGESLQVGSRKEWTKAEIISDRHKTQTICDRIFSHIPNPSDKLPLTLYLKGTNFQIQVWRALFSSSKFKK